MCRYTALFSISLLYLVVSTVWLIAQKYNVTKVLWEINEFSEMIDYISEIAYFTRVLPFNTRLTQIPEKKKKTDQLHTVYMHLQSII